VGGIADPGKSAQNNDSSGGTLEERIENALKAQKEEEPAAAPPARGGSSDAPRPVRTMTFGPDGTPKAADTRTQRLAAGNPAPKRTKSNDPLSSSVIVTTQPTSASTRDDPPADEPPAEAAAEQPAAEPAPAAAAPRKTRTAAVAPAPAQTPQISEAAAGTGNFFVQIAARNDQDAAMAAFASLQQKYASVLGNHSPSVRKVDLGDKGVWFRLLVGPIESKNEADQLCEQLKTAGMKGCFARKD
jgi:cell division septation protein DedD